MTRVAVFGARGRMGAEVCRAVEAADDLELVARIEVGEQRDAAADAEVAVDFTHPDAVLDNLRWCIEHDIHAVVGQGLHQEAAEAVLPGFPHQGALDAQPGQAHRDIGGSTPGGLMKGGCGRQIGAGGDRYEIDQQLAYGDRVCHVGLIQVIG